VGRKDICVWKLKGYIRCMKTCNDWEVETHRDLLIYYAR
jgi:hypothetical protein